MKPSWTCTHGSLRSALSHWKYKYNTMSALTTFFSSLHMKTVRKKCKTCPRAESSRLSRVTGMVSFPELFSPLLSFPCQMPSSFHHPTRSCSSTQLTAAQTDSRTGRLGKCHPKALLEWAAEEEAWFRKSPFQCPACLQRKSSDLCKYSGRYILPLKDKGKSSRAGKSPFIPVNEGLTAKNRSLKNRVWTV